MRFIGDYPAKTDAKGRVFLPAAFRKTLDAMGEEGLVLRQDVFQKCLVLYPKSVWVSDLEELKGRLNKWNRQHQNVLREFVLGADEIELDAQGRLLISKKKLQDAGIENEVRFLAIDDRIEIWSKQMLEEVEKNAGGLGDDLEALLGKSGVDEMRMA